MIKKKDDKLRVDAVRPFLIPSVAHVNIPPLVMDRYTTFARSKSRKTVLGKCKAFGYFIVQIPLDLSGDWKTAPVWLEKSRGHKDLFFDLLESEEASFIKDIKVAGHKRRATDDEKVPRVYIDGSQLVEAGIRIGDPYRVKIDKSSGIITLTPLERS